mgnify:CR=1 FL=1
MNDKLTIVPTRGGKNACGRRKEKGAASGLKKGTRGVGHQPSWNPCAGREVLGGCGSEGGGDIIMPLREDRDVPTLENDGIHEGKERAAAGTEAGSIPMGCESLPRRLGDTISSGGKKTAHCSNAYRAPTCANTHPKIGGGDNTCDCTNSCNLKHTHRNTQRERNTHARTHTYRNKPGSIEYMRTASKKEE